MGRGITITIILLSCWWILLRGSEIDTEQNLKTCTSGDTNRIKTFCGYELGDNYTRHTVYHCRELTPEVHWACEKNEGGDGFAPSVYCRPRLGPTTDRRGCYSIVRCIPKKNFCGFKDLEEVKGVIRSTITSESEVKKHLSMLDEAIERGD